MDTLSYKTRSAKKEEISRDWYILDADGEVLGRMASRVANVLRGKHKASYTPHVDCGDYVIIINADKLRLTGNKMNDKYYFKYSGYPGGQRKSFVKDLIGKRSFVIIENAVKGMLPKNKLGKVMAKKLFIYAGPNHPHQAQQPKEFKF